MKVLIMGLPGSGKTYLAKRLQKILDCPWFNNDVIRKEYDDWDFSEEGRFRQANRMKELANSFDDEIILVDFVCPLIKTRKDFDPDIVIWLNTIKEGRFEDTNQMFEPPYEIDYIIEEIDHFLNDEEINDLAERIKILNAGVTQW